jgi:hypothetical protein
MAKLSQALVAVAGGAHVRRPSWINDNWHVESESSEVTGYRADILLRVNPDGALPWGVITASDVAADDYELADGGKIEPATPTPGTLAAAIDAVLDGKSVTRPHWKEKNMKARLENGALLLTLPNGDDVSYVFGPEEQAATDFEVL